MKMLEGGSQLNLKKRCELLSISRSSVYYKPNNSRSVPDISIMNLIHEIWLECPFYGYRRITAVLNREHIKINHKRVQRLMGEMGLQAIYPHRTTIGNKKHVKYPYLLPEVKINRPDQVWCTDITYIKMSKGFIYLVALIDAHSRYIKAWSVSICMDTEFCMQMLDEALVDAKPEIINTDQGCQFTSDLWTSKLKARGIKISMTSKGRCLDNVLIERFWRSFKQEDAYLKPYVSVAQAKESIRRYIEFYNYHRPHQSLDYKTPAEVYFSVSFIPKKARSPPKAG